jgi:hypothetical protein
LFFFSFLPKIDILSCAVLLLVSIHPLLDGDGVPLAELDFVVGLGRHAAGGAAEDQVGHAIHHTGALIVALAGGAHADQREEAGEDLQAVAAPDEADVVVVQSETVPLPDDDAGGGGGQSRTQHRFEAHAGTGTDGFAQVAPAAEGVALAAPVVGPPGSWLHVVQCPVPHVDQCRTEAQHRSKQTTRFPARCLTHANIVLIASTITVVPTQQRTVPTRLFVFGKTPRWTKKEAAHISLSSYIIVFVY